MLPPNVAAKISVDVETGCWIWKGFIEKDGYGMAYLRGRTGRAHRIIYAALIGEIPSLLHLDHLCGVRPCVNPEHLEPVDWQENNRRSGAKRRKAACVNGHPMVGENVAINAASGRRYCRECNMERAKEWRAKDPEGYREQQRQRYRSPEGQQWQREYRSRPEVLAREAARMRRLRAERRRAREATR